MKRSHKCEIRQFFVATVLLAHCEHGNKMSQKYNFLRLFLVIYWCCINCKAV